jgi:hypothetical protein
VPAAREELQAAGVEFHGDIIDSGSCHQAIFSDPDGTMILHHRYACMEPGPLGRRSTTSTPVLRSGSALAPRPAAGLRLLPTARRRAPDVLGDRL